MRSALGNSLLLYLVLIFIALVMLFFVGTLTYSKAFTAKNRIIEIVEKYEDYNSDTKNEINTSLKNMGYTTSFQKDCSNGNLNESSYRYCIYKITNDEDSSYYYKVETFIHFDFPFIGDRITIPVKGETKILGKNYDY